MSVPRVFVGIKECKTMLFLFLICILYLVICVGLQRGLHVRLFLGS